jgi:hypothetical protein
MAFQLRSTLRIFYIHVAGCSARENFACGGFAVSDAQLEEGAT